MADITSPIALDESFNTTETTPRNIADVVADETGDLVTQATAIVTKLQALINAVKPNASDIPLDPITGMSANNVQLGISELKGTLDYCFQSDDSTVVGLATDTTILSFGAGSYKIALPSASEYIPIRYGVLNVFVARDYVFCLVLDSGNNMYKRFGNNNTSTWYTNWAPA